MVRQFYLADLEWHLRTCISNKLPVDAIAVHPWTQLESTTTLNRKVSCLIFLYMETKKLCNFRTAWRDSGDGAVVSIKNAMHLHKKKNMVLL